MRRLILLIALAAQTAWGQYTPPAGGAYTFSAGAWSPASTTATQGAVGFVPPSIGLYCYNSSTSQWAPCAFGTGNGTVTSVAATGDGTVLASTVGGSPVTTSGTLAFTLANAAQNSVLAGPPTGGAGAPTYQTAPTFSAANLTNFNLATYLASPPAIGGTTPAAGTFTTAKSKVINGVSYSNLYTGATFDIRAAACLADAETLANGNTSHKCNSSGDGGAQTIATTVACGDTSGDPVDWVLPAGGLWTISGVAGTTHYGIDYYSGCVMEGSSAQPTGLLMTYTAANGTGAGVMGPGPGGTVGYVNIGGFSIAQNSTATIDNAALIIAGADNTDFHDMNIQCYSGGANCISTNGANATGICCRAVLRNITANAQYTGGIPLDLEVSNSLPLYGLHISNVSLGHPTTGNPVFKCNDTSTSKLSSVSLDLYEEGDKNVSTATWNQITGCASVTFEHLTANDIAGGSTTTIVSTGSGENTALNILGGSYPNFNNTTVLVNNGFTGVSTTIVANGTTGGYFSYPNIGIATGQTLALNNGLNAENDLILQAGSNTAENAYSVYRNYSSTPLWAVGLNASGWYGILDAANSYDKRLLINPAGSVELNSMGSASVAINYEDGGTGGLTWWNGSGTQAGGFTAGGMQDGTAASVATGTTIAPTTPLVLLTGATPIATITLPSGFTTGCFDVIPGSTVATTTAGNIEAVYTLTANTNYRACWNGTKWYFSPAGTVNTAGTGLSLSGTTLSSNAVYQLSFQPGLLSAVTSTKAVYSTVGKAATVDNITGSSMSLTCGTNPTITMYECGVSATCASPTTIGSVQITAAGQAFTGTISSAAITAGDFVAFAISAGVCTTFDISATAQVHSN
jgi:hypothetical protein